MQQFIEVIDGHGESTTLNVAYIVKIENDVVGVAVTLAGSTMPLVLRGVAYSPFVEVLHALRHDAYNL